MTGKPFRIAYVLSETFDVAEPGAVFSANTAIGFAEAGAESLLVAAQGKRSAEEVLFRMGLEPHEHCRVRLARKFRAAAGPVRTSWGARFRTTAVKAAWEFGADAVVCRDLKTALAFAEGRFEGRILFEMHDAFGLPTDERDRAFYSEKTLRARDRRVPLEKRVLERVDGVVTLTSALAEALVRTRPVSQRVVAAPTACRPLADPAGTAERRHIAYMGSMDALAGVGALVRVMDLLPAKARLLIFGLGASIQAIREAAATAGVAERIDFTGFVAPAQLPHHLARCRVGALPLADTLHNRVVAAPLKVSEYLASGVVPVVPDFPVFREMFPDDSPAVFFAPEDGESLAAAIAGVFADEGVFRRRHLAALHQATQWTWRDRAERIIEFARDLPYRAERKPRNHP